MRRHSTTYVALVALGGRAAVVIKSASMLITTLLLYRGVVMRIGLLCLPSSNQILFAQVCAHLSLLCRHRSVVQLDQVRKSLDDVLAVVGVLANRVVPQPENFEREILEVANVAQIVN